MVPKDLPTTRASSFLGNPGLGIPLFHENTVECVEMTVYCKFMTLIRVPAPEVGKSETRHHNSPAPTSLFIPATKMMNSKCPQIQTPSISNGPCQEAAALLLLLAGIDGKLGT
jgi:hypothetical protein